jgi:hypothetical protein
VSWSTTATGFGGGISPELSASTNVWSLAAGLTGPIFQGGQILETYRANVAAWERAKLQYEQVVITAFQEVSSALTAPSNCSFRPKTSWPRSAPNGCSPMSGSIKPSGAAGTSPARSGADHKPRARGNR